jgi:hypothetical protein
MLLAHVKQRESPLIDNMLVRCSPMSSIWTTTANERLTLEGVIYMVRVVASREGDYRGLWHCSHCGQSHEPLNPAPSSASALAHAKDRINVHHAAYHAGEGSSV